ncbi:MAG: hypothetical protein CBC35_05835 [Planctomycetes bacterium TMED75]|nr:hypothetical protein [Planctomycetaceae bacterium]OUU93334.1 MAG: hypothetical protein CBC35_05835 [Planctomycetes bacterium TMED75]
MSVMPPRTGPDLGENSSPAPVRRPVLLGAAFLALVCGFVGIFVGLSIGGLREVRNTAQIRADPVAAEIIIPSLESSDSRLVLLGDSRIAQWAPLPESETCSTVSIGVGGLTAPQLAGCLGLYGGDLSGRTVLVQIGINDLKTIGYSDRSQDEIVEATREAIQVIRDRLVAAGADVRIMTILPPGSVRLARRVIWTPRINQAVAGMNAALRQGEIVPANEVLDLGGVLGTEEQVDPAYSKDALHLNPEGYEALSKTLRTSLPDVFGEQSELPAD